jgi:hypothetical protein
MPMVLIIEKASVDNEQRKSGSRGVVGDQVERTKTPCWKEEILRENSEAGTIQPMISFWWWLGRIPWNRVMLR